MSSGQFSQLTGQLVTESGQFGVGVCELVTAGGHLLNTTVSLLNLFIQKAHLNLKKIKHKNNSNLQTRMVKITLYQKRDIFRRINYFAN